MSDTFKRLAGNVLWNISYNSPAMREKVWPYGIRTRNHWFVGKMARAFLPDGKSIRLTNIERNFMAFLLHWHGWIAYEPITLLLIKDLLKDRQCFVHVGGNIGYFPIAAAIQNPSLKIFAFEPNPKINEIFRANMRANHVNNVVCEGKAVSEATGTLKFYLGGSDMSGSLESGFLNDHTGVVDVPIVSLDDYLKDRGDESRLVKIIVEGHEAAVIRGAKNTLSAPNTDIILAVVRELDQESHDFLKAAGYSFYQITDDGLVPEEHIHFIRKGAFNYLDHLCTRRPPAEVKRISDHLQAGMKGVDRKRTSYYRPEWEKSRPAIASE